MPRIVLITSEMAGRVNVCHELARRLTAEGHEVLIGGPSNTERDFADAEAQSLDFRTPATEPGVVMATGLGRWERLVRLPALVASIRQRQEAKVAALGTAEFVEVLRTARPDLVLIDLELSAHILAARVAGFRVVGWTSMLSVWDRPGLPPLDSDLIPEPGNERSVRREWRLLRSKRHLRNVRLLITRIGEDRVSIHRRLARDLGVSLNTYADFRHWLIPFVPRDLPTLVFNARQLDFEHDPLPTVYYVGPLIGARPRRSGHDDAASIQRLAQRRSSGATTALFYCGFGAWEKGDDIGFYRMVVRAFARRPDWDLMVGLGGRLDPTELEPTPPNVHVFRWAPQAQALQHADGAIHHAGISSVNECIGAGVPMLVYPFEFLDQPGNAARVEHHGLGIRGDRATESEAAVIGHLEELLTGRFDEAVKRMQSALMAYQSERVATSVIDELFGSA